MNEENKKTSFQVAGKDVSEGTGEQGKWKRWVLIRRKDDREFAQFTLEKPDWYEQVEKRDWIRAEYYISGDFYNLVDEDPIHIIKDHDKIVELEQEQEIEEKEEKEKETHSKDISKKVLMRKWSLEAVAQIFQGQGSKVSKKDIEEKYHHCLKLLHKNQKKEWKKE